MKILLIIIICSLIPIGVLYSSINLSTPPPLSTQIDMKSFSPKNLHGDENIYTQDSSPTGGSSARVGGSSWGGGSSGGK